MTGGHRRGQHGVSCAPGAGLEIGTRLDLHLVGDKGCAESIGQATHDIGFGCGVGAKTMINVMGNHVDAGGDG